MEFIQNPTYVLTILLLLVIFSEWLAQKRFFKHIGSVLIVIITAAIMANLGIIPSSTNAPAIYDGIFTYAAPLGIFFLLLEVRLKDLKFAGLPMIMMFLVGSAATSIAVIAGYKLLSPQNHFHLANAVAGMYAGTYTGGSANLNAVALGYEVNKDGVLYAAVNAADNVATTIWMILTLAIPVVLQRIIPMKRRIPPQFEGMSDEEMKTHLIEDSSKVSVRDLAVLFALGLGTMFAASQISAAVPSIPSILIITTLALIFAQIPFVHTLNGGRVLAMILLMLFLAVIGAFCDLQALINSGDAAGILLAWVTIIVTLHGLIIFGVGWLLKMDWDIVAIASNANIGGATSAPVCAASLGRPDLQLPAILAGSIGNAIGTYIGFMIAGFFR